MSLPPDPASDKIAGGAPESSAPDAGTAARPTTRLLLGVVAFVLAFGAAGYAWRGNFAGLGLAPGEAPAAAQATPTPVQITAMVQRLADKLKAEPNDPQGWSMLGRAYSVMGEYPKALEAFQKVVDLTPQDAQAYADLADASAMASGRKLDAAAEKLIQKALALDPNNAKAQGLAGTLDFDRGDPAGAARHWEIALASVEPGTEMATQLRDAVDAARQRAGLPALPATSAAAASSSTVSPQATAAASGASLQVRVSLAPALAAQAQPDETVFIFARAAQGPKMPLAIARRQVKDLPLTLTLDDSMAMSPALRLSSQAQVVVGARISKSGNPLAQPGDLQGLSGTLALGAKGVAIEIGEIVR